MGTVTLVHDCDIERRDAPSPTTLNGDFRDATMNSSTPDTANNGSDVQVGTQAANEKDPAIELRGLLLYDLTKFLPKSAVLVSGVWWINVNFVTNNTTGSYEISRLTRTDWLEDQATWNSYKTGSPWTTPGGDFTTPTIVLGTITTTGWKNFNITSMVTDAWSNRGGICTFIMRQNPIDKTLDRRAHFESKESLVASKPQHHLRVTYTLADKTFQVMLR